MIIDIHTHTFPDVLAPKALAVLSARAKVPPCTAGTISSLRASMQQAGVTYSCLMPIATKPSQARAINTAAAAVNREFAELISFGSLHPAQEDWAAEIAFLVEQGIPGIKLHPDYQDCYVDEPRMLPIYRALADAGRILLVHAGVDIGLPPPVHCTPDRMARVLDAVPELTVIVSHMGGYALWDAVAQYLVGRDCYLDTSYSLSDLGVERMTALITAHGVSRILFGTDSPWTDQAAEIAGIRALGFTDEETAAILGGNAACLLGVQ